MFCLILRTILCTVHPVNNCFAPCCCHFVMYWAAFVVVLIEILVLLCLSSPCVSRYRLCLCTRMSRLTNTTTHTRHHNNRHAWRKRSVQVWFRWWEYVRPVHAPKPAPSGYRRSRKVSNVCIEAYARKFRLSWPRPLGQVLVKSFCSYKRRPLSIRLSLSLSQRNYASLLL